MDTMVDDEPSMSCLDGRATSAQIAALMLVFGRKHYVFLQLKEIGIPKFRGEATQFLHDDQLDVGFDPVQEIEFPMDPPREENEVLVPDEQFCAELFKCGGASIVLQIPVGELPHGACQSMKGFHGDLWCNDPKFLEMHEVFGHGQGTQGIDPIKSCVSEVKEAFDFDDARILHPVGFIV